VQLNLICDMPLSPLRARDWPVIIAGEYSQPKAFGHECQRVHYNPAATLGKTGRGAGLALIGVVSANGSASVKRYIPSGYGRFRLRMMILDRCSERFLCASSHAVLVSRGAHTSRWYDIGSEHVGNPGTWNPGSSTVGLELSRPRARYHENLNSGSKLFVSQLVAVRFGSWPRAVTRRRNSCLTWKTCREDEVPQTDIIGTGTVPLT
jgi:hypothetical protein